jgi:hypothetical protein
MYKPHLGSAGVDPRCSQSLDQASLRVDGKFSGTEFKLKSGGMNHRDEKILASYSPESSVKNYGGFKERA